MTKLIDSISLPDGLRNLSDEELSQVAEELRSELIHSVSRSGGHFASSLGVTELTVALHTVFDTPNDKLIWDVGHQGYIHKMVTGRREQMGSIRQQDGLSGFLRRDESAYDEFGAGHAGTSISAGVGLALAAKKDGREQFVVPVIGDGALTCGMAFEALNHAGTLDLKNFIVVLNDNEMSISKNVGALSWFFSKAVTGETSTAARKQFKDWYRQGYIPEFIYKAIDKAEESAQSYFSDASVLFEAFGFRYIGPVDGHNVAALRQALFNAKRQEGPVVVHAKTVKGKGFEAAEIDPLKWHGVTPFDPACAQFNKPKTSSQKKVPPAYTDVFADTLIELAKEDPKIIGITAAMPTGTGLDKLAAELPEQFIDVAICEQHAVTFAAGLACAGYKPVCAIYSTFLQRGYDQVVHDVCVQNLPVVFAIDRAGAVGNDGETHQGLFDISFLRTIPNMTILAPKDEAELRQMLYTALQHNGPVAVRYPRGKGVGASLEEDFAVLPIGKAEVLKQGARVAILAAGPTVQTALEVAAQLSDQYEFQPTVVSLRSIKPLDSELIRECAVSHDMIVTIEDHALSGGVGSAVLELLADSDLLSEGISFLRFGAKDSFTPHATQDEQYEKHGYDSKSIFQQIAQNLGVRVAQKLSA